MVKVFWHSYILEKHYVDQKLFGIYLENLKNDINHQIRYCPSLSNPQLLQCIWLALDRILRVLFEFSITTTRLLPHIPLIALFDSTEQKRESQRTKCLVRSVDYLTRFAVQAKYYNGYYGRRSDPISHPIKGLVLDVCVPIRANTLQ